MHIHKLLRSYNNNICMMQRAAAACMEKNYIMRWKKKIKFVISIIWWMSWMNKWMIWCFKKKEGEKSFCTLIHSLLCTLCTQYDYYDFFFLSLFPFFINLCFRTSNFIHHIIMLFIFIQKTFISWELFMQNVNFNENVRVLYILIIFREIMKHRE